MDALIFDRNSFDVEEALNNPNSTEHLKGAYNYIDLNRVESWGKYIQNCLIPYGFNNQLNWKNNWNIKEYPTLAQINRIRSNIIAERDFLNLTNNIEINNTLNYEQANELEKIFQDILDYFDENFYTNYSDGCIGAITAVNEYFSIKGKNLNDNFSVDKTLFIGFFVAINEFFRIQPKEIITENFVVNSNNKLGSITAINEYYKIKKED